MALNEATQIKEAWKQANTILVTFAPNSSHDGVASALAVGRALETMGKRVEIVAQDFHIPAETSHLYGIEKVKSGIEHLQKFVIEVPVHETQIKELSYEVKDSKLCISLIPKKGTWKPEQVTSRAGEYRFDLICAIGAADLKSLGNLFHGHTEFFYQVPVINIDHNSANECYGQVNHVNINATSCGETIYYLLKEIDPTLIDTHVATHLLTGMVTKTKSFKTPNVTPQTLHAASELVTSGAEHDKIMHSLYRTRTVSVLRLWGRALARLKHDLDHKLVWTLLTRQDFMHAGANHDSLPGVIDELILNATEAQVTVIIYEDTERNDNQGVIGLIHTKHPLRADELANSFNAEGSREKAIFKIPGKTIVEAEPLIINTLKEQLAKINF